MTYWQIKKSYQLELILVYSCRKLYANGYLIFRIPFPIFTYQVNNQIIQKNNSIISLHLFVRFKLYQIRSLRTKLFNSLASLYVFTKCHDLPQVELKNSLKEISKTVERKIYRVI